MLSEMRRQIREIFAKRKKQAVADEIQDLVEYARGHMSQLEIIMPRLEQRLKEIRKLGL